MKKLILLCLLVAAVPLALGAKTPDETLKYRVMYKWGLINKQAGTAVLTLTDTGADYSSRLTASSEPWADRFFMVRDTLMGNMQYGTMRPTFYEKLAHEGGDDKHDTVRFIYNGNSVTGQCTRIEYKKGQLVKDEKRTLEATGPTVDMLSSFYRMRNLPFTTREPGHRETLTIFSGKQKETLTFWYRGIEPVLVGDRRFQCYHVTFVFTGSGGKKTSDDMDAWITTDSSHTPVLLEGKLPVGKVRCEIMK